MGNIYKKFYWLLIALFLFIVAGCGIYFNSNLSSEIKDFLANVTAELIGLFLTIILVERVLFAYQEEQKKKEHEEKSRKASHGIKKLKDELSRHYLSFQLISYHEIGLKILNSEDRAEIELSNLINQINNDFPVNLSSFIENGVGFGKQLGCLFMEFRYVLDGIIDRYTDFFDSKVLGLIENVYNANLVKDSTAFLRNPGSPALDLTYPGLKEEIVAYFRSCQQLDEYLRIDANLSHAQEKVHSV